MYCKACGQVIDNDSVFCSFCGVKQSNVVTKSEKILTEISGEDRLQNIESKISRPVTPKYDDSFEKESTTAIVGFFMLIGTLILVIFKPIQFPSQSAYEQGRAGLKKAINVGEVRNEIINPFQRFSILHYPIQATFTLARFSVRQMIKND